MKRWLPVLCIALLMTLLPGASAWEGSAMMSAYGEFPESGYYAACNSFPRNTAVEVVNLENGKTVTVIVTKGLDNPGIFLLLSPEAAKVISMEPGTVSRVRVSAPRNIVDAPSSGSGADPDFNPSLLASRSGPYTPPVASKAADSAPPAEPAPEPPAPAVAAVVEAGPAEVLPPAEPKPEPSAVPEGSPKPPAPVPDLAAVPRDTEKLNAREAPLVRPEVLARSAGVPQPSAPVSAAIVAPDISTPKARGEETAVVHGLNPPKTVDLPVQAALADPVLVPDELPEAALTRRAWPADPEPSVALADLEIRMDESGKPEALARAPAGPAAAERSPSVGLEEPRVAARAESEPKSLPPVAEPAPVPDSSVAVSLEPASPKPPEAAPRPPVAKAPPETPAAAARPVLPAEKAAPAPGSTALVAGKYYIQIGAFKTSSALDAAAARLAGSFPVTVDTITSGSSQVYRLFVGPLGRDETGVALLQVRSLGFKEAFLKN